MEAVCIAYWFQARPKLKEKNYPDLIDPRIIDSHDVHQLFWMVRVAEKCLSKDPHKRVAMDKVVIKFDKFQNYKLSVINVKFEDY